MALNQRPDMILEVQIQILGASDHQSFHFQKISGGLNLFVKIGTKLPITLKNKRKNTNLKFEYKKLPFWTPEKAGFWFLKKNPPQKNVLDMCKLGHICRFFGIELLKIYLIRSNVRNYENL